MRKRNQLIVDELVEMNHLHPAFTHAGLPFQELNRGGGGATTPNRGPNPINLAPNEQNYLRHLMGLVVPGLVDKTEKDSGAAKSLLRELLVSSVLAPIVNLITPDNVNSWILLAIERGKKNPTDANTAAAGGGDGGGGGGGGGVDTNADEAVLAAAEEQINKQVRVCVCV